MVGVGTDPDHRHRPGCSPFDHVCGGWWRRVVRTDGTKAVRYLSSALDDSPPK
ncbi:hypothetical protein [Streptosporangium sp. NPDC087985]|uniref:hypothetical protein n=1 Tax=Streptosporangium sp. NPDC087985 TaxID=3366196 RepID=UPI0038238251